MQLASYLGEGPTDVEEFIPFKQCKESIYTSPAIKKCICKILFVEVICRIYRITKDYFRHTNSVGSDQTAPRAQTAPDPTLFATETF